MTQNRPTQNAEPHIEQPEGTQTAVLVHKGYGTFGVSQALLDGTVLAIRDGEQKARSTGEIQTFEVSRKGHRQLLVIGRVYIVPPAICENVKNFPTALLYGALVSRLNPNDLADLETEQIGGSDFDEYSTADMSSIKDRLFKDDEGKFPCLVFFNPAWTQCREQVFFRFTKEEETLKNLTRHLIFSAYYNPALSSAWDLLMEPSDALQVSHIDPKTTFPWVHGPVQKDGAGRSYPELSKTAGVVLKKAAFCKGVIADLKADVLEGGELEVLDEMKNELESHVKGEVTSMDAVASTTAADKSKDVHGSQGHRFADGKCEFCGTKWSVRGSDAPCPKRPDRKDAAFFSEDQPRDPDGKFASGGGNGASERDPGVGDFKPKPYSEWTQEEKNRDWADRHNLPVDDKNRVRLYHSTPKSTADAIAKEGLKDGSFLTDDKATAMQQAGRDRGLKAGSLVVFEAWVPLGSFHGGTWAQTIGSLSADALSLKLVDKKDERYSERAQVDRFSNKPKDNSVCEKCKSPRYHTEQGHRICSECGNGAQFLPKTSAVKFAYVSHCPGHTNSKGEKAEWCIKQHNTGKILESFKSEGAAKDGLKNMESHKGSEKEAGNLGAGAMHDCPGCGRTVKGNDPLATQDGYCTEECEQEFKGQNELEKEVHGAGNDAEPVTSGINDLAAQPTITADGEGNAPALAYNELRDNENQRDNSHLPAAAADITPVGPFSGDLVKYDAEDFVALINAKYGWSVSAQAESILEGGDPNDQNSNALRYIYEFAKQKGETELAEYLNNYFTHDLGVTPEEHGKRGSKNACMKTHTARGDETINMNGHDYKVSVWDERDRLNISVVDECCGDKEILDLWDDAAREAIEDGFIDPRNMAESALEYADSLGLLKSQKPGAKKCDQCEMLSINGVATHERGCPKAGRGKRSYDKTAAGQLDKDLTKKSPDANAPLTGLEAFIKNGPPASRDDLNLGERDKTPGCIDKTASEKVAGPMDIEAPEGALGDKLQPFSKTDWYGWAGATPWGGLDNGKDLEGDEPLIAEIKVTNWPEKDEHGDNPHAQLDTCTLIVDATGVSINGVNGAFMHNDENKESATQFAQNLLAKQPIDIDQLPEGEWDTINMDEPNMGEIEERDNAEHLIDMAEGQTGPKEPTGSDAAHRHTLGSAKKADGNIIPTTYEEALAQKTEDMGPPPIVDGGNATAPADHSGEDSTKPFGGNAAPAFGEKKEETKSEEPKKEEPKTEEKEASAKTADDGGTFGWGLTIPGQCLRQFRPDLQHEIVDYPNAVNSPMIEDIALVAALDNALETKQGYMDDQLDGPSTSTSPAAGAGIGRDGKEQVLEGAPLRKENDIRGYGFSNEFYKQFEGVPGAYLTVAGSLKNSKNKKASKEEDLAQFKEFLKLAMGEVAASFIAIFKASRKSVMDMVKGEGEVQLFLLEEATANNTEAIGVASRVKYLIQHVNDGDLKEAINESFAQAAVWNEDKENGFCYEVFVRAENLDTDTGILKYTFVTGTKGNE